MHDPPPYPETRLSTRRPRRSFKLLAGKNFLRNSFRDEKRDGGGTKKENGEGKETFLEIGLATSSLRKMNYESVNDTRVPE